MRRETIAKSATIAGAADLTIIAPIRKGFVPSLDAVTYKTRVKRVLKTLHLGRTTSHEFDLARVLSDAVERVGRIHSIRIALIEPEDKVMLAVTFDGSWESYIRVIWQKVARSLDLVFCNTEDYVTGWDHSFDEWCAWLRAHQAETPFLYSPAGLTYQDTQYLRIFENRHRQDHEGLEGADLATTRIRIPAAEEIADRMRLRGRDPSNLGLDREVDRKTAGRPAFRQGVRSLAGLYRLTDLYVPDSDDGKLLHGAAVELLRDFVPMVTGDGVNEYGEAIRFAEKRFKDQLDWFRYTPAKERRIPELPLDADRSEFADVQGGIVSPYPDITTGCLVLLACDDAAALGRLLQALPVTAATDVLRSGDIAINLALTVEGLRLAGLTEDEVRALPEEFVQGMERRASVLGDTRINHPRRWRLPPLNASQGANAPEVPGDADCQRVDLRSVHLAVQLRLCDAARGIADPRARLWGRLEALLDKHRGTRALSVQWMHRLAKGDHAHEHFGFLDSDSAPVLAQSQQGEKYPNVIHLGEILRGYDNAADFARKPRKDDFAGQLLRNGTFLVIRKLRQDVSVLEQALEAAARRAHPDQEGAPQDAEREEHRRLVLAKMMGRWPMGSGERSGQPLAEDVTPGTDNDFTFQGDKEGAVCPFHAHIRRANPRETTGVAFTPPGARPPRIIRRGMSYGPFYDRNAKPEQRAPIDAERGLVFMAYNASIGEQFEVVQRWLSGGNSSGSYSGQSDPFVGVAEPGRPRHFRFEHDGQPERVRLDGDPRMHAEPRPIVRLEWGMYLFTPSLKAIAAIAARAAQAGTTFARCWSVQEGERLIAGLRELEASQGEQAAFDGWKAVIEDPASASEYRAASIWAAIRARHGGLLRTPFGVLVASRELVDEVLLDRERHLTATGYLPRMERSFGALYLGMDAGQIDGRYERESVDINKAIVELTATPEARVAAVLEAAAVTQAVIDDLAQSARERAEEEKEDRWEVTFDAREVTEKLLAHFCELWFGLSEREGLLRKGAVRWTAAPGEKLVPSYPGHFMAPSRYTFQPHPSEDVERIGAAHGVDVRVAMTAYLNRFGHELDAPVAKAVLKLGKELADPSYPARTLAGVLMGFLPTTDGNLRRVLDEWLNEGTLWSLRDWYAANQGAADLEKQLAHRVRDALFAAMQLRAAPELLWRMAATGHDLGADAHRVRVRPGEYVVASLISATQESLERGEQNVDHAFGGRRGADALLPTHACPGYGPAMSVLTGFFMGLVQCRQPLRAGPGALSLAMEGRLKAPADVERQQLRGDGLKEFSIVQLGAKVRLLAIGDSWQYRHVVGNAFSPTLASELADFGYAADTEDDQLCTPGKTLETLVTADLQALTTYLGSPPVTRRPKAVLVSCAGNDLVPIELGAKNTPLYRMLRRGGTSVETALDMQAMRAFIEGDLKSKWQKLLEAMRAKTKIPILIHGYDRPFPDGREAITGHGPWLLPVFVAAEIPGHALRKEIMQILIDRLNEMLAGVAQAVPGVHHLGFAGVLEKQPGFANDYTDYWANELHATERGYRVFAKIVADKLAALGVS